MRFFSIFLLFYLLIQPNYAYSAEVVFKTIYGDKYESFFLNTLGLRNDINEIVQKTGRKPPIGYHELDVNNDGTLEYLIVRFDSKFCKNTKCNYKIYQKLDGSWKSIFDHDIMSFSLLPAASGYHQIKTEAQTYTWQGSSYN